MKMISFIIRVLLLYRLNVDAYKLTYGVDVKKIYFIPTLKLVLGCQIFTATQ